MNCPHYFVYLHYTCSRQEAINLLRITIQPSLLHRDINGIHFYSCQHRLCLKVATERHCQSYSSNTETAPTNWETQNITTCVVAIFNVITSLSGTPVIRTAKYSFYIHFNSIPQPPTQFQYHNSACPLVAHIPPCSADEVTSR